jgi:hypothetical protein
MKKLVFGLIATVVMGFVGNAQDKDLVNLLSKDKNFILIVDESIEFNQFLNQTIEKNSLSIKDLQLNLSELKIDDDNINSNSKKINEIFKSNVSEKLVEHNEIYFTNLKILNEKYKELSEKTLKLAFENVIKTRAGDPENIVFGKCGWRYNLCLAADFAATAVCHAGCNTTALATTAGLGIPACVWACGTMMVFLGVQCYDNYCH